MRTDTVLDLMLGAWKAQVTFVLARLGVPDELAAAPRSAHEVAAAVDAHPEAMLRLLRAGAALGLLFEAAPDQYGLTPLGECLRSDAPVSMRRQALSFGAPSTWRLVGELEDAIRTGRSVASKVLGRSLWEHLAEAEHFSGAMGEQSARVCADVAAALDPAGYRRVVDVGGAYGVLLTGLLEKTPQARGVLFDRPSAIEAARPHLDGHPLKDRVELIGGDFFRATVLSQLDADSYRVGS